MVRREFLITQDRRDAADRVEVRLLAEREHLAAVGQHLVDGEVEALVPLLHPPSRRAGAGRFARRGRTPGTARRVLDALLEHEALDTPSDADSSVSSQPDAARPLRPASSFQRHELRLPRRCHFSSTGCETS